MEMFQWNLEGRENVEGVLVEVCVLQGVEGVAAVRGWLQGRPRESRSPAILLAQETFNATGA